MVGVIERINLFISSIVWGPAMIIMILFAGVYFSVGTGFFQIRKMRFWMKNTIVSIFIDKSVRKSKDKKSISQFGALSTALAGTMGTGNIAGVATAIFYGGPGAVFWMWISAMFGMMTGFAEKVLGLRYRYRGENGEWVGGAMVYMERGLNSRWLGMIFAFFLILSSFGMGNMVQANSLSDALFNSFGFNRLTVGIITAIVAGAIILGGIRRISRISEKIIPFITVLYIAGGVAVILVNGASIPGVIRNIIEGAFNLKALGGGLIGGTMIHAMRYGISRGVFSNEAGLGSSVCAHTASDNGEPVVQGMWGIFEVFLDTIVVCTITALAILTSGAHEISLNAGEMLAGVPMTSTAFSSVFGDFGGTFVSLSVVLFAFATIMSWAYYGESGLYYLAGKTSLNAVYRAVYIGCILLGSVARLGLVWDITDTLNGLLAVPNLIALFLLSPQVFKITKEYMHRKEYPYKKIRN